MTALDILLPYQRKFFQDRRKRKIWLSSRQVGKSLTIAAMLVCAALQKKNGLSLCISTGARAANEIISKCALWAEAVQMMTDGAITYSASAEKVSFSLGSRVLSLPSSTDGANLRGFTASMVAIDEACYVSNLDQILQAIAPTLTRDNNAQLVFTTTPAGKNSQFYKIYEKALDDDEWLVQKTTIYDAVEDGLKVDVKSLMKLCPDPDIFAQEYECQWAASSSSLCKSEDLDFKDMQEESSSRDVLLAVDVGVKHDKTAMAVGKEIDGVLNVVECTVLDKMPFEKQLKAIQAVEAKYHVKAGVIDANGVGYGLAEMVSKQCSRLIKPYTWSQKTKANAHEMLRTDILTHKIAFPESVKQQVIDDFERVQKTITDSGKAVWTAKHDKTGHADLATAIAMLDDLWHKKPANASIIQTAPIPSVF